MEGPIYCALPWIAERKVELSASVLLSTETIGLRDVLCAHSFAQKSPEESSDATYLVFPYRGVFVHHLAGENIVADANQLIIYNVADSYRISHPVDGGDDVLSLSIAEAALRELAPREQLAKGSMPVFHDRVRRLDASTQLLAAQLRHGLARRAMEPLEAETRVLTLVRQALGGLASMTAPASSGRRKVVDRAKLILSSDPDRRWTLAQIAAEVGVSPVYLTQLFQQVEAQPLYRYQLRLRMARALDLLGRYDDLTALALDLGFSSHSHFSAAFRQTYGHTPAQFQRSAGLR